MEEYHSGTYAFCVSQREKNSIIILLGDEPEPVKGVNMTDKYNDEITGNEIEGQDDDKDEPEKFCMLWEDLRNRRGK